MFSIQLLETYSNIAIAVAEPISQDNKTAYLTIYKYILYEQFDNNPYSFMLYILCTAILLNLYF